MTTIPAVANKDRLTGLDSSFLHLERDSAHMHVAGCSVFEGTAPSYDELLEAIDSRLHLVPRYRQRLAFVPLGQGRPVWVDDPHYKLSYHVRHTALPRPGGDEELSGSRAACSPRRSTAAGRCGSCGWSKASRTGASRCCPRRIMRSSTGSPASTSRPSCSTPRPTRCRWHRPTTSGSRVRSRAALNCWPTPCSNARPCRPRWYAGCGRRSAARERWPNAPAVRSAASAHSRGRACRPLRRLPST